MAKYFGKIGYFVTEETSPGIWEEHITERDYYGEINRVSRRLSYGEGINNDIHINNELSIVADPFAVDNFQYMLYAEFMGAKWKIESVTVEFPRLTLSLGGLYNE